jgi:hypothetical protein
MAPPTISNPVQIPGALAESRDASLWGALHSRFLEGLSQEEQLRIFDLTVRTATPLYQWAGKYPLIRRVRVWPLALSVAAAARFAPVEALVSTARLSLWVFTLDDLFDEEHVPEHELMRRADRYRSIAFGEPVAPARDSLATALREIRDDLATYPLFSELGTQWADALAGTIDGMIAEYRWRQRFSADPTSLPSYDEYLASGLYSIGGPPHVWAAVITSNDTSTPAHVNHLRKMEKIACTCIRLANDLQSYKKELEEGNINSIVVLSQPLIAQGVKNDRAYELAAEQVRAAIQTGIKALDALQADQQTETGHPEGDIADIARFVCDFYSQYDYHTFEATQRK